MGLSDHPTCLLRNLCANQETTVRTGYRTTDWFKIGKEYDKAAYCHLLFKLLCRVHHAKCQAGWITSWNQDLQEKYQQLRYADDTILRTETEEELKSLLMRVKEESEKSWL